MGSRLLSGRDLMLGAPLKKQEEVDTERREIRATAHGLVSVATDLKTHTRRRPPGVEPRCATRRITDGAALYRLVRIRASVVIFLDMGLERASAEPEAS